MPLAKHLSKEQILDALSKTKSNRAAARFLGCSYTHYKRHAKLYKDIDGKTLFDKHLNPSGKGVPKFLSKTGIIGSIKDIIEGRISASHFTPQKIRDVLISEGYFKEECGRCGLHEYRLTDFRMPLILNFKDKNKKNYAIKNLELICYNCYFLFVADLFSEKQILHLEDNKTMPKTQEINWEISPEFEEHFKSLGIIDKPKDDGSEFISRK